MRDRLSVRGTATKDPSRTPLREQNMMPRGLVRRPSAETGASADPLPAHAIFNPCHQRVHLHARLQPVAAVTAPVEGSQQPQQPHSLTTTHFDFAMQIKHRQAMRLGLRVNPGQSIDGTISCAPHACNHCSPPD